MKRILATSILLLFGCSAKGGGAEESVIIKTNYNSYRVPAKYFPAQLPRTLVPIEGLDKDGNDVTLKIPLSDLGVQSEDSLIVYLSAPDPTMRRFGLSFPAYEAWFSLGLYSKRVVVKDDKYDLFRVGSEAAYPLVWHYFTRRPEADLKPAEFWFASCTSLNGKINACSKDMIINQLLNSVTITGQYISQFNDIQKSYEELVHTWEE